MNYQQPSSSNRWIWYSLCILILLSITGVVLYLTLKPAETSSSSSNISISSSSSNTPTSSTTTPVPQNVGRYVKLVGATGIPEGVLNIAEVKIFSNTTENIAKNKIVTMSSTLGGYPSTFLVDDIDTNFAHTNGTEDPWMEIDLGTDILITKIIVKNRVDCCGGRTGGSKLQILDSNKNVTWTSELFKNKDGSSNYQNGHDGKPLFVAKPPDTAIYDNE